MHGRAVVPEHQVTQRPSVPVECGLHVGPDLVQQALRFSQLESHDVSVEPAAEIEGGLARYGMLDDHRMRRTYGAARVVRRLQSFAQEATRIVRPEIGRASCRERVKSAGGSVSCK